MIFLSIIGLRIETWNGWNHVYQNCVSFYDMTVRETSTECAIETLEYLSYDYWEFLMIVGNTKSYLNTMDLIVEEQLTLVHKF